MKRFLPFGCLPIALALLGGCAASSPGAVRYQLAPDAGGDKFDLTCLQSSTGSCRVRIESAKDGVTYADVTAGTTQTLQQAAPGARYCVSDTAPGWFMCKVQHARFEPPGALVTVSHR